MSETTFLLLPGANNNGGSNSSHFTSDSESKSSSLELGTLSPSESISMEEQQQQQQDDAYNKTLPRNKQQRSLQASYKMMTLVGIFAFGIAVRLFGFTTSTVQVEMESSAYGSLVVPSSSLQSHNWHDETHHEWEDFLAGSHRHSHSHSHQQQQQYKYAEADLGAATGNLLGSTIKTRQKAVAVAQSAETTKLVSKSVLVVAEGGGSSELLYFNQTTAFAMLNPMEADFFHYQNGWEAQITQALCAVATTAALINSLRYVGPEFELPMDPVYKPFPWATQKNLLASAADDTCVVEALGGTLANADAVYHIGLGLTMVPRLMNCFLNKNGYEAIGHPAVEDDETETANTASASEAMKALVLEALRDPKKRVVYNYDRGGIGQGPLGHGHWSPLGGYHEPTDSFLVMDVAKYKHPMVWVSWTDLWSGATTIDFCGTTLSLDLYHHPIDWSKGFAGISDRTKAYLLSRCIPGHRGFVVVGPRED